MKNKVDNKIMKCENCGGNLVFSPLFQNLVCEKCGLVVEIKKDTNYEIHDFSLDDEKLTKKASVIKEFNCLNCGALIKNENIKFSNVCPYCSSPIISDDGNEVLKPDAIIPFAFDKNEASQKFVSGLKHKLFLPNKFKKAPNIDDIEGIYFPVFAFNQMTVSKYDGKLEHDSTTTINGTTSHTVSYQNIFGVHQREYDNIYVECSDELSQLDLKGIMPYQYDKTLKYTPDFVRGYNVEKYNTTIETAKNLSKTILHNEIRRDILSKYNYSRVSYLNIETFLNDEKYYYSILPVYKCSYEYKGKTYSTFMNGQTGQVGNNVPRSKFKIAFAISILLLLFAGFVLLAMFL